MYGLDNGTVDTAADTLLQQHASRGARAPSSFTSTALEKKNSLASCGVRLGRCPKLARPWSTSLPCERFSSVMGRLTQSLQ